MKLTYLGTAAAEAFPAVFCHCEYCREARRLGGKNIRSRSQALVNDDLLIDLPADTYSHFIRNGIEGDRLRYLLITHAHGDHLYPEELRMRGDPFSHDMRQPTLQIFCSETAKNLIGTPPHTTVSPLRAFETVETDGYRITALPARHMLESQAFFYIIQGDKTLLYAHDTGYFYEEVFAYIEQHGCHFDMVSLDCTNADLPISDEGTHMGFPNIERVLARLRKSGAVDDATVCYVNHFSHNGNPLHDRLCARAAEYGCAVSYDGCVVEF